MLRSEAQLRRWRVATRVLRRWPLAHAAGPTSAGCFSPGGGCRELESRVTSAYDLETARASIRVQVAQASQRTEIGRERSLSITILPSSGWCTSPAIVVQKPKPARRPSQEIPQTVPRHLRFARPERKLDCAPLAELRRRTIGSPQRKVMAPTAAPGRSPAVTRAAERRADDRHERDVAKPHRFLLSTTSPSQPTMAMAPARARSTNASTHRERRRFASQSARYRGDEHEEQSKTGNPSEDVVCLRR